jgi:hypothetical protein
MAWDDDVAAVYEAAITFETLPNGMSVGQVAEALTAELGILFYPPRAPLHRSRLLRPWAKPTMEIWDNVPDLYSRASEDGHGTIGSPARS